MKKKTYLTNCVACGNGRAIISMVDDARTITRRTFLKHVDADSLKAVEADLGYEAHHSRGVTMAGDYHVSYYKSVYRGKPCVYFEWSSMEYIFT